MIYANTSFKDGQVVTITGISFVQGAFDGVFHVIIDGVTYMYEVEQYDNYHSYVACFIVGGYDVMPVMKKVNFKAVVDIRHYEEGDCTNVTFTKIHGNDMVFRIYSGACDCCREMDSSIWITDWTKNRAK